MTPGQDRAGEDDPACRSCGGILKSATISFGQPMPAHELARAEAAAQACDLFIVIGSSLVVYPAAALPLVAKRNGARLAIVNREPTDLDPVADLVIRDDIATVLDPLAGLNVTTHGFGHLVRMLVTWAETYCGGRLVGILEGGYDAQALATSVIATISRLIDPDAPVHDPIGAPR